MTRNTIEQLFGPHLRGPMTTTVSGSLYRTTHPHAGYTTVTSGVATATCSTALVNSDSIILVTTKVTSAGVGVNSGGGTLVVNSVVPGVSFAVAWPTAVGVPWDTTGMWLIVNPKQP